MSNIEKLEEYEKIKGPYRKQRERGFWSGIFFLTISVFFICIGIVTQNYNVFYGVFLQLFAGVILVLNNLK